MTGREFDTYLKELRDNIRMWSEERCDDKMIISLIIRYFCDDARAFVGYQLGEIIALVFAELSEENKKEEKSYDKRGKQKIG